MDQCPNCPTETIPPKINTPTTQTDAPAMLGGGEMRPDLQHPVRRGRRLPPGVRDAIAADIGVGKLSFSDIAKIHATTRSTVHAIARGRGLLSPYSPRLTRTEAARRAEVRESKAHKAIHHKSYDKLDSDTLSKIAERASGSLDKHVAALERANIPPAQIVISPDVRILANIFAITPRTPCKALGGAEDNDLIEGVAEVEGGGDRAIEGEL